MIFMTFISIYSVIICVVLPWRTYETHPYLSFKSGCDRSRVRTQEHNTTTTHTNAKKRAQPQNGKFTTQKMRSNLSQTLWRRGHEVLEL
jgi:hypothetical protein